MTPNARLCILLAICACLSIVTVSTRKPDWGINDISNTKRYYLVLGSKYFKYEEGLPRPITGRVSELFPGLPSGIQAATWWPGQDKYFFFKNGKYYWADKIGHSVIGPFEGSSLGDIFKNPIAAATVLNGKTYFYQRSRLYEYDGPNLKQEMNRKTYRVYGKVGAGITLNNVMYFFTKSRAWPVSPYSTRFTTRIAPIGWSLSKYLQFTPLPQSRRGKK